MAKHNQTIRPTFASELSVFDHFVGLVLKGLKTKSSDDPFAEVPKNIEIREVFKNTVKNL